MLCHSPYDVPGSRDASSISQMFRRHNEVKCLIQGQAARKQSQVSPKSDSVLPPFYMHAHSHSYILTCLHTFKHTDTPTHTDMFTYAHTYLITLTFSNAHTQSHMLIHIHYYTHTITLRFIFAHTHRYTVTFTHINAHMHIHRGHIYTHTFSGTISHTQCVHTLMLTYTYTPLLQLHTPYKHRSQPHTKSHIGI